MKIKSMKLEEPTKTTLMYDSGAQSTVVNDIQLLSNPIPREATVSVANDGISIATHVGKLILCGQGITITLPKAWYCPLMSNNFISTHDIAEAGYTVGHDTDTLWVISNDGQQRYIIAKNPGDRAFYGDTKLKPISLPIITRVSKQQYVKISNVAISEMPITYGRKNMIYYHLVCGHASVEALKSLKKLNVLEFNDSPEDEERIRLCQTCRRVNLTAKPHNKTHIPAERIHERIHSDTMGPIEGSKGNPYTLPLSRTNSPATWRWSLPAQNHSKKNFSEKYTCGATVFQINPSDISDPTMLKRCRAKKIFPNMAFKRNRFHHILHNKMALPRP